MIRKVKEFKIFEPFFLNGRQCRIIEFLTRYTAIIETGYLGTGTPWAEPKRYKMSLNNMRKIKEQKYQGVEMLWLMVSPEKEKN